MNPIPFRRGAYAAAALGAAFALAVIAEPAAADTEVSVVDGNFGAGANGRVLKIVEERDLFANERMRVRVSRAAAGNVLVADTVGEVVASAGCQLLSTGDARCSGPFDGILMQGTEHGDVLDNDVAVISRLEGRAGNDILDGGDANDNLIGDEGDDTLNGGEGGTGDRIIYSGSATPVAVTLGDGVGNDGGTAEDDTPVRIEHVVGSRFADQIVGSDAANVIEGRAGNDTLKGGPGDDAFDEGEPLNGGDDVSGGDGIDRVVYLGRTIGVNVSLDDAADDGSVNDDGSSRDNVRSDIENVVGTDQPDTLTGDGDANLLDGRVGGDRLEGLGGGDTMLGGGGDDTVSGFDGDDTASGGDGADRMTGAAGRDTLRGDAGADNIDGGPADDVLEGGNDADRLSGADGADRLLGEGGGDELSGGGGGDLLDGAGDVDAIIDYVRAEDVRVTVDSTREVDPKTPGDDGSASDGPAGQRDTVIEVETIRTGRGKDRIEGNLASETFFGGPGDDTLIGNAGADDLHADNPPGVPFLPDEQPGIDEVDGGEGRDRLFTKDGLVDKIRCGTDVGLDGLPLPPLFQPQDELEADLADVLPPHPDSRLGECERLDAEAVGELPGARIVSETLKIDRRDRARVALRCPAETLTDSCAGRLTVAAVGKPKELAAATYRLDNGKRDKVKLRLSRRAARRLLRHNAAIVKAIEQDRSGRPKITSELLRVKGHRR
jgi:Ca2+-binding RTX toxin-like protein